MTKTLRYALFLICAVQFFLAITCFLQLPLATTVWPFEGTTPLTFIFVASILAAAAASTLWVAVSENYSALAGIGLDYFTIFTPLSVFSFQLGISRSHPALTAFGIVGVFLALCGLGLLLWSVRLPLNNTPSMPSGVRWSFIIFVLALLSVSLLLLLKVPNIIPWTITPDLSVVIGWTFLGASAYFVYALLRPSWLNSAGQLAGFLAYDLVLIIPFLTRLPTIAPEHRLGLIVYLAIVIYSGLVAIYYLFIHKPTRVWA